jgi:hypothetical protein
MTTGVGIWCLEDGWKEIGKVHELFCKRVMGMPNGSKWSMCERIGKNR